MANYEIRPLQLRLLKILLMIDRVFKAHNIPYYIIEGTLLGAVRHKGFIPWDDDIDIGVPRKYYDMLCKNANKWLPEPYEWISSETMKDYPLSLAKIQDASTTLIERLSYTYKRCGIFVDVFPLDGMSGNKWEQSIHFLKYHLYKKIMYFSFRDQYKHGKGVWSRLPLICRKLCKPHKLQRLVRRLQMEYDYDKSAYVINHDDGKRGIMPKSILGMPTPILFENEEVMGVENCDAYLKHIYGNYMQIPPKEEQRQHNFHYLDLNKPYSVES